MLKIGEFAKICNVSASTLRFYDTEGVLCPDYVDEESGYRYYSEEKIQIFRKIETLKEMNFSLDEIKQVLDSEKSGNLYVKKISELAEKISGEEENNAKIVIETVFGEKVFFLKDIKNINLVDKNGKTRKIEILED